MAGEDHEWLARRRDLLRRGIAELEEHLMRPHLNPTLNPDVPGCLAWALGELERLSGTSAGQERLRGNASS